LEDPRDYLESDDDREAVDEFMATLAQGKVRVLRADRRIVLPRGGLSMLKHDAPYPESPDVRDAVAIALDGIDPRSWGASSEIRNGLWRAMRRTAVAPRLLGTPKSVDLKT